MSQDDFQVLNSIVDEMQFASIKDDLDALTDCDIRFHNFLIQKCASHNLLAICNNISGKIHSRLLYQGIKHESFTSVVEEHLQYLALIKEGNPDKIRFHLDSHIK